MREKKSRRLRPEKVLIRLFLSVVALVIIIPILNILAKSISDPRRVPFMEGWQFWPEGVDFVN